MKNRLRGLGARTRQRCRSPTKIYSTTPRLIPHVGQKEEKKVKVERGILLKLLVSGEGRLTKETKKVHKGKVGIKI